MRNYKSLYTIVGELFLTLTINWIDTTIPFILSFVYLKNPKYISNLKNTLNFLNVVLFTEEQYTIKSTLKTVQNY